MPTATATAVPLTANCARLYTQPQHLCIGVSPFHSYFTTSRITALAAWATTTGARADFFLPDRPAVHTLLALGYLRPKAQGKARRQGQYLHNKIRTATESLGVQAEFPVLDWTVLAGNPVYRELLARVHRCYRRDPPFRAACQQACAWVLQGRLSGGRPPSPAEIAHAVRYLLAELPLLLDTAAITGAAASLFCYQHAPRIHRATVWRHAGTQTRRPSRVPDPATGLTPGTR